LWTQKSRGRARTAEIVMFRAVQENDDGSMAWRKETEREGKRKGESKEREGRMGKA